MKDDDSFIRKVRTALTALKDHGIITKTEMKTQFFKQKYGEKFGINQWAEVVENGKEAIEVINTFHKQTKEPPVYYFSTDLKFILKARLCVLEEKFIADTTVEQKKRES
jgi:hypothetical protein